MSASDSIAAFRVDYRQKLAGVRLASRFVHRMPRKSLMDRANRVDALTAALRVMRMGEWRPVFPFIEPLEPVT